MNKKKSVMATLLTFTLTFSMFSAVTVHATEAIADETMVDTIAEDAPTESAETEDWKNTVDTFVSYMRLVNWSTGSQGTGDGVISRHFFEEIAQPNDVAFVTYYNENYYNTYYNEERKEIRIPHDTLVNDAKKYYKNIPDLTKMNTKDETLHYDTAANEFVWPDGGGVGDEPLATEIEGVDELGNETYGIRFKVSENHSISENPDMNDPTQYTACTLVVEANESGQWRYVSFLEGYPYEESKPNPDVPENPDTPAYSPTLTLVSSTWTGENDIVLNTQTKGGTIELAEMYLYIDDSSIGGIRVTPEMKLDSEGNGTITFNSNDLKKAKMWGPNGEEEVDWTKIDQMEISFQYELDGTYKMKAVYVPVEIKASSPENTTTITNSSGVTMVLPENAPDNLELKVAVSTGADEKSAIEKIIKIDGDKIKTFDLSLLLDGQAYEYNGQFTSTVSLPIPDGWDMSKLALYYFNEDTKEVTPVTFSVDKEKGTVVFSTSHFSKYVLVQKDTATEESNQITDNPKTGDQTNVGLYTSLFAVSILGIAVLAILKKKKVLESK